MVNEVKRYKANYLFTIMFQLTNILITTIPCTFIIFIFGNPNNILDSLEIFPTYGVMVFVIIIFSNILHFIISIFTKHNVDIDNEKITHYGKKIITKSVRLEEVFTIRFYQGEVSKTGNNTPCSIDLFDELGNNILAIDNPSFLMIICLIKRCKNAKFKFMNYRMYIILTLVSIVLGFLLALFA